MHTAFGSADIICKGYQSFIISVIILQSNFSYGIALTAAKIYNIAVKRSLVLIKVAYILSYTALIAQNILILHALTPVLYAYCKAGVEKGLLTHTGMKYGIVVYHIIKELSIGLEAYRSTNLVSSADNAYMLGYFSTGELHLMNFTVLVDFNLKPFRQCIYNGSTHTMQAA